MSVKYHVYTFLWNDVRTIKSLLKHYETADRIVVYDGGSTDEGPEIVRKAGRELRMLEITDHLDDSLNIKIKNNAWKESRGHCDYVIVQDTDEFLFFPDHPNDIIAGLTDFKNEGVTASYVDGYSILTSDDEFAEIYEALDKDRHPSVGFSKVMRGDLVYPRDQNTWIFSYDKPFIFDPSALQESNFYLGQHLWQPFPLDGLKFPSKNPWMLHWRFAGEKHETERLKLYRERLRHQWSKHPERSAHYNRTDEEIEHLVSNRRKDSAIKDAQDVLYPDFVKIKPSKDLPHFLCQVFDEVDRVSNLLRENHIYEPEIVNKIISLCSNLPDCLFIDVGAFTGSHSFTAAAAGAKKVVAIECYNQSYSKLKTGIKVNGWDSKIEAYNYFLSDTDDEIVEIKRPVNDIARTSIKQVCYYNIPVKTKTFDNLNINLDAYKNLVVKIDTNGHEFEVLSGMPRLLADTKLKTVIIKNNPAFIDDSFIIKYEQIFQGFNFEKLDDYLIFNKPLTD